MDIKFIQHITCTECEHKLTTLKDYYLMQYIQERKGLMRCRGCSKLRKVRDSNAK